MIVSWQQSHEIDPSYPVTQVYGLLVDDLGRVLIHNDQGNYNLPGGKPEPDEDFVSTLARECLEESQVTFTNQILIGSQLVENDPHSKYEIYSQLRYLARIQRINKLMPDPCSGRAYPRTLCPITDLNNYLNWGPVGDSMVATALKNSGYFERIANNIVQIDQ